MKKLLKLFRIRKYRIAFGISLGIIGGYLYYYFVGCASGSCAIQSSPWLMMAYGAFFGYVLFDGFISSKKNKNKNESDKDTQIENG